MDESFYRERGLLAADEQYKALCNRILQEAKERKDRTGVGTLSVFGHQMRFDLEAGFPLLTRKRVHFPSVLKELLWLISGSTNNNDLLARGCTIWNEWAREDGDLGPVYGKQWRRWQDKEGKEIDQLAQAISAIKNNPTSRRIIVSVWNVGEIDQMALPPCHSFFQFYVDPEERTLSCQMYQRSADVFLGLPFNIASYALLTMMVAQVCGLKAKHLVHTIGDAHIYSNHISQVEMMISRKASPMPAVTINQKVVDIDQFQEEDIVLKGYLPRPTIKGDVAV
ncbi:thymidylate synthase [Bdellovibrio sp. BCCA]|uniref:thymidylate synthase n=1 Tax=Bdellovibrio sp. BCCA TaxID=3136281 RepID=UPI0030F210B6